MKATIGKYWNDLRSSYWFIPALMAVAAIILAFTITAVDEAWQINWVRQNAWLFANRPQGARALLSTIAGSMITVAGVTFSVTISALAYASSQFGPRLLTNFMQDRGNQFTLGTFTATFIYCLLVLRTVRGADEIAVRGPQASELAEAFVPHTAVLVAIVLALASVAVLIYFIHHISISIHISHVAAQIGQELKARVAGLCLDESDAESKNPPPAVSADTLKERLKSGSPIGAECDGYIQTVVANDLLKIASAHDLLLFVNHAPGDFVIENRPLVYAWPAIAVTAELKHQVRACFAYGVQRTPHQDVLFLAQELIEIAGRALSPGVNDPFTAINCSNWLASALATLAGRQLPSALRCDGDGKLRLVMQSLTFEYFADMVFDRLRPYFKKDRSAALHLMKLIGGLVANVTQKEYRTVLLRHAELLNSGCSQTLDQEEDRSALSDCYWQVQQLSERPELYRSSIGSASWNDTGG